MAKKVVTIPQLHQEFFERFAVGVRNYEAGEWLVARDLFITCHYSEVWQLHCDRDMFDVSLFDTF